MAAASTRRELVVPVDGGDIIVTVVEPKVSAAPITVLCVHGWTLDQSSFAAQEALVTQGITVAHFDRRGFGRNSLVPDFGQELMDLDAILTALETPVVLYGVSQGARLVLRYVGCGAFNEPAGLILQGGHLDGLIVAEAEGEAIPFDRYRDWLAAGDLDAFRRDWLAHPLVAGGNGNTATENLTALIQYYRGADLLTPGALPQPMNLVAALAGVHVPTLVITGSKETVSRRQHAQQLAELLHAELVEVAGGGHLCNISHPDIVNAALGQFLTSLAAQSVTTAPN